MDCRVIWREDGAARARARQRRREKSFSRRLGARALATTTHEKSIRLRQHEGGEAPKGACQPLPRSRQTQVAAELEHLIGCAAARRYRRRARLPALRPRLSPELPSPTQLQAMLPGIENQAGVTRSILSQFSGSTPRLGRSTEGNDARSRSGAACEPARKHRTRPTLQIASGMRPSDERDFAYVS